MINIKDACLQMLKNKDIRNDMQEVFSCVTDLVYEQIENYIWIICIYTIFLIILILANSIITMRMYYYLIYLNQKLNI
jgi:hypothetical protein